MPQARHLLICMQSESLDGDSRQRSGDGNREGKDRNKASGMRRWIFRIWREGSEGLERQSNVSFLATLPNNSKKSSAWKRRAPQHAGLFF